MVLFGYEFQSSIQIIVCSVNQWHKTIINCINNHIVNLEAKRVLGYLLACDLAGGSAGLGVLQAAAPLEK